MKCATNQVRGHIHNKVSTQAMIWASHRVWNQLFDEVKFHVLNNDVSVMVRVYLDEKKTTNKG